MKVTLEPTSLMVTVNGVPCRVWQGQTESGLQIHAHIALVGTDERAEAPELEAALQQVATPRAELAGYPLRLVL